MADYQVGDRPTLVYTLRDPISGALTDGTVTASAANADTGATAAVTVTHLSTGTYAGTFDPGTGTSAPGVWEVTFNSTGVLVDEKSVTIFIAADAPLPPWAPTLRRVGSFVPSRTRAVGTDNSYTGTFNDVTEPTDEQVSTLIDSACAYVASRLGTPIMSGAYSALSMAAALWTAYWVELAYPDQGIPDVNTATQLRQDALDAVAAARDLNVVLGGGGSVDETGEPVTLVQWAAPPPPRYADVNVP